MNTTPFFCFPGSWSRVKSPLGLGEIFFHFFYSGVIKISCKISKIIQQIIIFKTNAGSVQVIKNNQVVFRNLLSFSPGLLVNFFQNFLPILFKKVNFCFFRIFWFFQRFAKDLGRKSWRKINWLWLWQNFHLKFLPVTFSAEFVSSTCQSRGDCFGINLQVFCCCCNAGINLVKILRSDVNRSGVLILGLWFFFPRSCYGGFTKTGNKKKTLPFTETVLSSQSQIREQAAETAWRLAPIDLAKSA